MLIQSSLFHEPSHDLLTELAHFRFNNQLTITEHINHIPYFINEFWTSSQRQAHRIHEISYRACFKPQLPAFFISRLSEKNDIVYDPFMGRGTTPVQAAIQQRIPFGNDINPVSLAFTEPRVQTPAYHEILHTLHHIPWEDFTTYQEEALLAFYHPATLAQIEGLKQWLLIKEQQGGLNPCEKWIRMVALNRLTGHSSGFFSVYTLPPNQAVSVERQQKINIKYNQSPPERNVAHIIAKKSKQLLGDGQVRSAGAQFFNSTSDNTPNIPDKSIALTITSPPFLDIVNYEADNWLRCWFLGIHSKTVSISHHKHLSDWQSFIHRTLKELTRITKVGGHIAFEVGEVRNGNIRLEEYVINAAKGLALIPLCVMINQQDFTKTSHCWGVNNNKTGTNSNRIVIFKRIG